MNRTATWGAAAVLAVAAVAGLATRTGAPTEPSGTREVAQNAAKRSPSKAKIRRSKPVTVTLVKACADLEEALQAFLLTKDIAAPEDCYEDNSQRNPALDLRKKASSLRFVIATLPDPLHTHFPLLFDRDAEAIQQAAADEQYVFDSSWLPWDTDEQTYTRFGDQNLADDEKDAREDQPGIIFFRKKESGSTAFQPFRDGLVVFVVGEEATRGIHRPQFQNAAAWINALQPNPAQFPQVSILGPTFSGSLPSLAELLSNDDTKKYLPRNAVSSPNEGLNIYSGGVTGRSAAVWFGTMAQKDPQLTGWNISFHSFLQNDDEAIARYCAYTNGFGPSARDVAVISEDETAYGSTGLVIGQDSSPNSDDSSDCVSLRLYYPRDISALRSAYQSQSIFSSSSSQSSADLQRRILPTDLADPAGQSHDTIQAYGDNQDALSQEADLLAIVSVLRAHDIAYLVLRSSNTLDALFLSNFFRRAYPEGRVVIMGSDLLFQRERGSAGISGVMMLSTYPLLPWEQDWTKALRTERGVSHREFAEDLVEGAYVAGRFLLHDPPPGAKTPRCGEQSPEQCFLPASENDIPDYEAPFWAIPDDCKKATDKNEKIFQYHVLCPEYLHPVIWLSVMGRDDFYPLAALSGVRAIAGSPANHYLDIRILPMPIGMKLCLLGILAFALFHLACCWKASFTAKPAFRAHFAGTYPGTAAGTRHRFLILIGSVLIGFMAVVSAWGCGLFASVNGALTNPGRIGIYLLIVVFMAFGSIVANGLALNRLARNKIEEIDGEGTGDQLRDLCAWSGKRMALSLLFGLLLMVLFYLSLPVPLESAFSIANRVPVYWRSMNITSGVSPIVPLLVLIVGFYAWFWYSLHGIALFGPDRCRLPVKCSLKVKDADGVERDFLCMFSQEDAAAPAENTAVPVTRGTLILMVIAGCSLVAVSHVLTHGAAPLRSLGTHLYARIFCLWLCFSVSFLLAEAWQLLTAWRELKKLLAFLDRVPLRRTFRALRGFSWGSVWTMSGNVLEVRYKLLSRQAESLHHLRTVFRSFLGTSFGVADRDIRSAIWECLGYELPNTEAALVRFVDWYSKNYRNPDAGDMGPLEEFQISMAALTGKLFAGLLVPAWREEGVSLIQAIEDPGGEPDGTVYKASLEEVEDYVRAAEEVVCLPYLGFIQNILGRLRTIALGIVWLFVAVTVSVSTYPFDPRPLLSGAMIFLFFVLCIAVSLVYAEMHRDSTLSNVTNTKPGELGLEFWFKILQFGIIPLLGLLASVFPGFAEFFVSWLQPGLSALK